MGSSSVALPPGFELEQPDQKPQAKDVALPPGFEIETAPAKPSGPTVPQRIGNVISGAEKNIGNFVGAAGGIVATNPEYGGQPGQVPTHQQIQRQEQAAEQPMVPLSKAFPEPGFMRGVSRGVEGLTTPENAAIVAGLSATAAAAPEVGYAAVAFKAVNAGLGAYFSYQMGKGATDATRKAYEAWKKGDWSGVAENLGYGSVQALAAAFGIKHLGASASDIARTKVPRPAAKPEVVPPEPAATPAAPAKAAPEPQTVDVTPTPEEPKALPAPAKPKAQRKPRTPKPKPEEPKTVAIPPGFEVETPKAEEPKPEPKEEAEPEKQVPEEPKPEAKPEPEQAPEKTPEPEPEKHPEPTPEAEKPAEEPKPAPVEEEEAKQITVAENSEDGTRAGSEPKKPEPSTPVETPSTEVEKPEEPVSTENAQSVEKPSIHPKMGEFVKSIREGLRNESNTGPIVKDTKGLLSLARDTMGGSVAEGSYEVKDLYDAMETAVNQHIAEDIGPKLLKEDPKQAIEKLNQLTKRLPTQTVRTKEQKEFQQFSTPPALSYLAAKVGNVKPTDTVLEPSAGTGSLAAWAKAAGAKVETNELSPRRNALLKLQGHEPTRHNAERIRDFLPDLKPTVVLMNPPFSATAGRVSAHNNKYGYQHVTSALDMVPEGGRLVAILGRGAENAGPFFDAIKKRGGSIRANVGLSGENYRKYGTDFDNRLVVIDKTPAQRKPITGDFKNLEDAYDALTPVIESRPTPSGADLGGSPEPVPGVRGEPLQPSGAGDETERPGEQPGPTVQPAAEPEATGGGETAPPARSEPEPVRPGETEPAGSGEGASGNPLRLETGKLEREAAEPEGTFEAYRPAKLRTGVPHHEATGTGLVETAVMGSIEPPDITYEPSIPQDLIDSGRITDAQLESIVYAGQSHEMTLPSGLRAGYMVGDGTGVGKGTIAAGIALDNWNKGRKRILWVSLKSGLIQDAQRDLDWVRAPMKAKPVNAWDFGEPISHEGVIFSSYNMLIQESPIGKGKRLKQIQDWNPDAIILDESHAVKNAVGNDIRTDDEANGRQQRSMFQDEGTKAGAAVLDLDKSLPDSRFTYLSATAFSNVRNVGYATRLGLWGEGTSFPGGFKDFLVNVEKGGVGAMELIARELKSMGRYSARQISFDGVDYNEIQAPLSEPQKQMYDAAVDAWQTVFANIEKAIEETSGGSRQAAGKQKALALKQFWNRNQNFYRQILTAMKIPTIIQTTEKALADGKSVFIDLQSTNEAEAQRQLSKAITENLDFADMDLSPKQMLFNYLDKSFPVEMMEEYEDENGNKRARPVLDDKGNPVLSQAAIEIRENIKKQLEPLKLPKSALDEIIDYFGADQVAEVSGRKSRLIEDPTTGKVIEAKRTKPKGAQAKDVNEHERNLFNEGKKRIAVVTPAGGTGFSFHSDKRFKNQQRRMHLVLEPGWSADAQMQKLGRTHRTNQVVPPEYGLVFTDLGGEKRFISAIASRLSALGALTRGERKAGGASDVLAKYDLESEYGQAAAMAFVKAINGSTADVVQDVSVPLPPVPDELKELGPANLFSLLGVGGETDLPITRLLNRILNLPTKVQQATFNYLMDLFDSIVGRMKESGVFDEGTLQLKALRSKVKSQDVIRQSAGGTTNHVVVEADFPVKTTSWEEAQAHINALYAPTWRSKGIFKNKRSGSVWAIRPAREDKTDPTTGALVPTSVLMGPRAGQRRNIPDADIEQNFEQIPQQQAEGAWMNALDQIPKAETEDVHLITGSVLGVWKQLADNATGSRVPVVSVRGQSGEPITGIKLESSNAKEVVDMLSGKADYSPNAIFDRVWTNGMTVHLTGAKLSRGRMFGESAFLVQGGSQEAQKQLDRLGLKSQMFGLQSRHYIPVAGEPNAAQRAQALEQLSKVLQAFPPKTSELGSINPEMLGIPQILKALDRVPPFSNYSGVGSLKDLLFRNLSQLEEASPESHESAVRAGASSAQASAILRTAVPQIEKALGSMPFEDFRKMLIQSRLDGLRNRWNDLADSIHDMDEDQLTKAVKSGGIISVLKHLEDKQGFPRDLSQAAATLLQDGDFVALKGLLTGKFLQAGSNVARVMDDADFRANRIKLNFQKALKVYKDLVEKPMNMAHAANEGIFSEAKGPLDTYYPLVPIDKPERARQKIYSSTPYKKPRNMANQFATGLADNYDTSMETFRKKLTSSIVANNRAALLQTLEDEGLLVPLAPGEEAGDIEFRGDAYQAKRVQISPDRTLIKDGKTIHVPGRYGLVPAWAERELHPILEQQRHDPNVIWRLIKAMNAFAVSGPADAVFHSANLMGALVSNTPFLGEGWGNKIASMPVAKRFTAIVKLLATDPLNESAAPKLQRLARIGALPDRFGQETFSKDYAEKTGAERRRFSFGPILYGPKGIDVRARLLMHDIAVGANPNITDPEMRAFVNQLGNYTEALQGTIERAIKKSGFGPFFTAGSTMIRNGVNAWTGMGPMPDNRISTRLWQQLTGGGIALVGLWAIAYHQWTGKWPWEDKQSRLLQFPITGDLRKTALAQALFGPGQDPGYVNMTFFNPLVGRGARTLGLPAAYDALRAGGTDQQAMEAGEKDTYNSLLHPVLGPVPRSLFVGAMGSEPYITSLRDRYGNMSPQFFPKVGAGGHTNRAIAAAEELNAFWGNVGAATGLGDDSGTEPGNRWARMVIDLAAPGLVGRAYSEGKKEKSLQEQRIAAGHREIKKGTLQQAIAAWRTAPEQDKEKLRNSIIDKAMDEWPKLSSKEQDALKPLLLKVAGQ